MFSFKGREGKNNRSTIKTSPYLQKIRLDGQILRPIKNPYKTMIMTNVIGDKSDQNLISPYNINTISTRQVMRIKKLIKLGVYNIHLSTLGMTSPAPSQSLFVLSRNASPQWEEALRDDTNDGCDWCPS